MKASVAHRLRANNANAAPEPGSRVKGKPSPPSNLLRFTTILLFLSLSNATTATGGWDAAMTITRATLDCSPLQMVATSERARKGVTLTLAEPPPAESPIALRGNFEAENDYEFTWHSALSFPHSTNATSCTGNVGAHVVFHEHRPGQDEWHLLLDVRRFGVLSSQAARVLGPNGVEIARDDAGYYPLPRCPECVFSVDIDYDFHGISPNDETSSSLDVSFGISAMANGGRLVGSTPTADFPHVGTIWCDGKPCCTASLIRADTVLTAAHCLFSPESPNEEMDLERLRFVTDRILNAKPKLAASFDGRAFPKKLNLKQRPYRYDAMLLHIDKWWTEQEEPSLPEPQLEMTPSFDPRICMNRRKTPRGCPVLVVGYGRTTPYPEKAPPPQERRQVRLDANGSVEDSVFYINNPLADACRGDSGGPVFFQEGDKAYLVALVSGGADPCLGHGVYTRLDVLVPWLEGKEK
jgi:hypothetical protein